MKPPIDIRSFHDQFILSRDAVETPPGWPLRRMNGWHLGFHSSLPVRRIVGASGAPVGFVLGHLIDRDGRMVEGELRCDAADRAGAEARLEEFIYQFGGRYAFLFLGDGVQRVYLDPAGTLAAVWCGQRSRVASTAGLLCCDEPDQEFLRRPLAEYPCDRPDQFFPAGLTAVPGVARLLPNHYLDLAAWRVERHYPSPGMDVVPEDETARLVSRIHAAVRRQVGAVVDRYGRAWMTLTAGRDSRMLLSCSRDFADRIELVTFDHRRRERTRHVRVDLQGARYLARRRRLRHRVVRVPARLSEQVVREYLTRTGYAGGAGKAWDFHQACLSSLDLSRPWLSAFGGEVGRATLWLKRFAKVGELSARSLVGIMRLPERPGFLEAAGVWIEGAPDIEPCARVALAYLENRMGCWAAPHLYGAAPFKLNMIPFCHRDVLDAMLRLPPQYRRSERLVRDLVGLGWPDLLEFPFNDYAGFGRVVDRVRFTAQVATRKVLGRGTGVPAGRAGDTQT